MDKIKQINEILENFDFEGVRLAMHCPIYARYDDDGNIIERAVWKMALPGGHFDIPTVLELRDLATRLLLSVATRAKNEEYCCEHTGPFKAFSSYGSLGLTFTAEEWECEDWEDD